MSIQSPTSKIPMGQKIAFGLGMLANQMFPAAISILLWYLSKTWDFQAGCGGWYP